MPLPQSARRAVVAHVARMKHDLGKYVALRQRWLGDEASLDERRSALEDDVLATRRGPADTVDALTIWQEFRPGLLGEAPLEAGCRVDLSSHPEMGAHVRAIDAAMGELAAVLPALRGGEAPEALVERGCAAAREVAERCRALDRQLRAGGEDEHEPGGGI